DLFSFDARFTGGVSTAAGALLLQAPNDDVASEVAPITRLARFLPSTPVPEVSNWVGVNPGDSTLKGDVYVIAHGFAPYFLNMVQANGTPSDPLKWWQTLNTC